MTCDTYGCDREVMRSSSGWEYRKCEACIRRLQTGAFGEPEWVRRARENRLPTRAEGGLRR
jgi:epoxyqueuosine reductase QueG